MRKNGAKHFVGNFLGWLLVAVVVVVVVTEAKEESSSKVKYISDHSVKKCQCWKEPKNGKKVQLRDVVCFLKTIHFLLLFPFLGRSAASPF